MFLNSIKINKIVNLSLVVACALHIGYIVFNILNPEFPQVKQYKKVLKDIEFPILFQICVNEFNLTNATNKKYHEYGYDGLWEYYRGESRYNSTIVGWAGHKKNHSTSIFTVEGKKVMSFDETVNEVTFQKYCKTLHSTGQKLLIIYN